VQRLRRVTVNGIQAISVLGTWPPLCRPRSDITEVVADVEELRFLSLQEDDVNQEDFD
jgi:hypothetical protein